MERPEPYNLKNHLTEEAGRKYEISHLMNANFHGWNRISVEGKEQDVQKYEDGDYALEDVVGDEDEKAVSESLASSSLFFHFVGEQEAKFELEWGARFVLDDIE